MAKYEYDKKVNHKPMNPQKVFCPNKTCLASGKIGKDNISSVHSQKERRHKCNMWHKTFVETTGAPFYHAHKAHSMMMIVITVLAYGCPVQAIVAAFGWDEHTANLAA